MDYYLSQLKLQFDDWLKIIFNTKKKKIFL